MKNLYLSFLFIFLYFGAFAQVRNPKYAAEPGLTFSNSNSGNENHSGDSAHAFVSNNYNEAFYLQSPLLINHTSKTGIINPGAYLVKAFGINLISKYTNYPYQGIPTRTNYVGSINYPNRTILPSVSFWLNKHGRVKIDSRYAAGLTYLYNYIPTKSNNWYPMIGMRF